jgi:hypothetical protein
MLDLAPDHPPNPVGEATMSASDELLARIERTVLRFDQRLDTVVDHLDQMAKGLTILANRIGEIHTACCGEQPPSELSEVLRELTAAVTRTGDLVQALIERIPPRPH